MQCHGFGICGTHSQLNMSFRNTMLFGTQVPNKYFLTMVTNQGEPGENVFTGI